MPLVQHKRAAYWFYRFLSIVYDTYVHPPHWVMQSTFLMRSIDSIGKSRPAASNTGRTLRRVIGMGYWIAVPETPLP